MCWYRSLTGLPFLDVSQVYYFCALSVIASSNIDTFFQQGSVRRYKESIVDDGKLPLAPDDKI